MRSILLSLCGLAAGLVAPVAAEEIGEVTTAIGISGANHRIVVEAFDPKVDGGSCFVSRALTGGTRGSLGIAEGMSDASINCRQTGPVTRAAPVYLTYSDRNIEGSPKNSISAVAIRDWN